jgi:uncharacterized protein (DUF2141 family)
MKQLLIIFSLFFVIFMTIAQTAFAGQTTTLGIHITGFDNSDGVAKVAVINSKENYETEENLFKGCNFKIENNEVIQTITLPYGEYAIKAFHDQNSNDELDTRMFGIPKERYGFSNNARGVLGPPEYEDARFILNLPEQKISIQVQ